MRVSDQKWDPCKSSNIDKPLLIFVQRNQFLPDYQQLVQFHSQFD